MKQIINKTIALGILVLLFCSGGMMYGQIEVDNTNRIGVGQVNTSSKINVLNNDYKYGLKVYNNNTAAASGYTGLHNYTKGTLASGTASGITNEMFTDASVSNGIFTRLEGTANTKRGVYNYIVGKGSTENIYGLDTYIRGTTKDIRAIHSVVQSATATRVYGIHTSSGSSVTSSFDYGIYNTRNAKTNICYGLYNYINAKKNTTSSFQLYGMYNRIQQNGAKVVYGMRNNINGDDTNTTTDQLYGIQTLMYPKGNTDHVFAHSNYIDLNNLDGGGICYGIKNYMVGDGTPNTIYGSHTQYYKTGAGNPNTVYGYYANISDGANASYGVWSKAPTASNHYAGYYTGNVYINGLLSVSSDRRLKDDIKDLSSSLSKSKKLKPKAYKIKKEKEDRENKDKKDRYGFIAQEIIKVYPELVELVAQPGEVKERIIEEARVEIDPEGKEEKIEAIKEYYYEMDGEPMYSVNYQGLFAPIVGAIQEQSLQIDDLKKGKDKSLTTSSTEFQNLRDELNSTLKKYDQLQSQINKLIDCTNCGEIELEARKIELDIDQLDMRLYPNPASDFVNLEVKAGMTGLLKISVFNEAGQLVVTDNMMLIEGMNVHRMESSSWTSGMYYITMTFNDVTHSQKVVVE